MEGVIRQNCFNGVFPFYNFIGVLMSFIKEEEGLKNNQENYEFAKIYQLFKQENKRIINEKDLINKKGKEGERKEKGKRKEGEKKEKGRRKEGEMKRINVK